MSYVAARARAREPSKIIDGCRPRTIFILVGSATRFMRERVFGKGGTESNGGKSACASLEAEELEASAEANAEYRVG